MARAAAGHGIEPRHQQRLERGQRNEFQGRFRHHAEQAFGTDKQAGEIEPGFVLMGASAQLDDGAAGQDDFQTEDKIAGDAVFEAARAAGVGGDVAADAAIGAAGRIGRIVKALLFHRFLQGLQDDAGLDDRDKIAGVDFLDAVHAGQGEDNAAARRDASADVAEARPARGDGDAVAAGKAQEQRDRIRRGAAKPPRPAGGRRTICRRNGPGARRGPGADRPAAGVFGAAAGGLSRAISRSRGVLVFEQSPRLLGLVLGDLEQDAAGCSTPRTASSFFTLTVKSGGFQRAANEFRVGEIQSGVNGDKFHGIKMAPDAAKTQGKVNFERWQIAREFLLCPWRRGSGEDVIDYSASIKHGRRPGFAAVCGTTLCAPLPLAGLYPHEFNVTFGKF